MDFFYYFIKNICIFTLVITLFLNIFPRKQYLKYIKLFAGLLLIVSALSPIINWKKSKYNISDIIEKNYSMNIETENINIEKKLNEMQTKISERICETETNMSKLPRKNNKE